MPTLPIVCVIAVFLTASTALAQSEERESSTSGATASGTAAFALPTEDESWAEDVLVALIGGGVRSRRIHLEVGAGADNRSFDTGAYFDFGWHLLIRPMGRRSPRSAIRAIVLQIDGGAGVNLTVEPVDTGISLLTNSWRMVGQVGYLYPIDRWQVGGLVGVGADVLNIDLNSVMPSASIVYVRLGPAASIDVVEDYLTIRADFGLRIPFHLGGLESAFGLDSHAFGLDSTVTFQGRIEAGFTYALRFVWEYFDYRFAGPTDAVPAMGDGERGHDHAIDLQLLFGWSL
jgi:hypothetical protein